MNDVTSTIAWCVLQVSLLALIGVTLATLIARRSAPLACSVLFSAASAAAVLTVLAPLPIHSVFVVNARHDSPEHDAAQSHALKLSLSITNSSEAATSESTANLMFDPRDLLVALQSVARRVEILEEQHRPLVRGTSLLLLAIISLGLLRLTAEVLYVLRTRRASMPLDNAELLGEVKAAAMNLGCRTVPEVRVHPEFSDAAIVGWFRPTLILPRDWDEWTACEQRAVITHEIAHIVRHDAPWRMMASCVLAMHFYNPIVHWLLRRAVLYQELSTDQMAAEVMGRRDYLRSLSSLAIRRDDQWGRNVSPRILPVFSGHLIRRIKVLHSKEGIRAMNSRRGRTAASALISAAFLVTGLAAIATRGIAQSPPDESKSKVTVQPVTFRGNVVSPASTPKTAEEMFHRTPIDPEVVGSSNPYGMVVIRVRELFSSPAMQPFAQPLNDYLSTQLTPAMKLKAPPFITVDAIEWIAVRPLVMSKATTDNAKSQVMIGTGGFIARLNRPIDLKTWVDQYEPDLEKHVIQNQQSGTMTDIYKFTFRPTPLFLWMEDPLTLRASFDGRPFTEITHLGELGLNPITPPTQSNILMTTHLPGTSETSSWAGPWNRIDRGLGSAVFPKCDNSGLLADFQNHPDLQTKPYQEMGRLYQELCSLCLMTGVSFDIAGETPRLGIRVSLIHSSVESAHRSAKIVRELLPILLSEYEHRRNESNQGEPNHDMAKKQVEALKEMFGAAVFTVSQPEQESAELLITTEIPLALLSGLDL